MVGVSKNEAKHRGAARYQIKNAISTKRQRVRFFIHSFRMCAVRGSAPCFGGMAEPEPGAEQGVVERFTPHEDAAKRSPYDLLIGNVDERHHGYGDNLVECVSNILKQNGVGVHLAVENEKAYKAFQVMADSEPTLKKQMHRDDPHHIFGFDAQAEVDGISILFLGSGSSVQLNTKRKKDALAADTSTVFSVNEPVAAFFPILAESEADLALSGKWMSCSANIEGIVITIKLGQEPFGYDSEGHFVPPTLLEVRVDLCLAQLHMECFQASAPAPVPVPVQQTHPSPPPPRTDRLLPVFEQYEFDPF